ncbi:cytochrome c5 family protein [Coralloluteibacterium stylophorae]|uniref:Cytochrome c5 family protein n=2 Tax=Coralloluteibacterium stylophorae TaxID=1776034 RepID=A0A8J7VSA7_9GAMM|nr:cytochrome c5 family protein [Coralloluteibacterium stylophorae]
MIREDLNFLKRFSMVIGMLVGVAVILIVMAMVVQRAVPPEADPNAATRIEQRLKPVGAVYAGATGAAAKAAAEEAARQAAASQVAFGGSTDGQTIYDGVCAACHGTGAGGAPTLDPSHWTARIAKGMDTLHTHAIEGFQGEAGLMPAKGGMPSLTDEQVIATVDWMVEQAR